MYSNEQFLDDDPKSLASQRISNKKDDDVPLMTEGDKKKNRMLQLRQRALSKRKLKLGSTGLIKSDSSATTPTKKDEPVPFTDKYDNKVSIHSSASANSPPPYPYAERVILEKRKSSTELVMTETEKEAKARGLDLVFDPTPESPVQPTTLQRKAEEKQKSLDVDFGDLRAFMQRPVEGGQLQCFIRRIKSGVKGRLFPGFELCLSSDERTLMCARKRKNKKTANYIISMDRHAKKTGGGYLGKVRSNFYGTEFIIYDTGLRPDKMDSEQKRLTAHMARRELCAVMYDQNMFGTKGPRKMTVLSPSPKEGAIFRPMFEQEGIIPEYKRGTSPRIKSYVNNPPRWNDAMGAYVLNFSGRVTMASVKNFQLINEEDPDKVVLQFGRVGPNTFTCDFSYPLSPIQAFGICLSSLDNKFSVE